MTSGYQDRKIAGLCTRCGAPAEDGYQLCPDHRAAQKRYAAACYKVGRKAREKGKRCMRCGKGKRKPGSRWCIACLARRGKLGALGPKKIGITTRDRIADRTEFVTEGDGRTRSRYKGKHVGRASAAEMDGDDIRAVRASLQKLETGLAVARSPEVEALPRIQRKEALLAALSHADHARRFLAEMLERHRYGNSSETGSFGDDV
jgi:hypothetical protein